MNRWRNPRLIASLLLSHIKMERVRKSSYDIVMTYNDRWTRSMYESSECVGLLSLLIKEFKDSVSLLDSNALLVDSKSWENVFGFTIVLVIFLLLLVHDDFFVVAVLFQIFLV